MKSAISYSEQQSKALYRSFVTDAQLKVWSSCKGNGDLVIVPRVSTPGKPFGAILAFIPPPGASSPIAVELTVTGGTIDGKRKISRNMKGRDGYAFTVEPEGNTNDVILNANTPGFVDSVSVPTAPPPAFEIRGKDKAPNTSGDFVVCSGSACRPGDWAVTTNFPTPFGDCNVEKSIPTIDTQKTKRVILLGRDALEGPPNAFVITVTNMHPGAYDNPLAAKNIFLCGYVKDDQPRRALLHIGVFYE